MQKRAEELLAEIEQAGLTEHEMFWLIGRLESTQHRRVVARITEGLGLGPL